MIQEMQALEKCQFKQNVQAFLTSSYLKITEIGPKIRFFTKLISDVGRNKEIIIRKSRESSINIVLHFIFSSGFLVFNIFLIRIHIFISSD